MQHHKSQIGSIVHAADQALLFAALAEFGDTVVPQSEPFCRIRHRRRDSVWRSGYLQQKLVLLRMKSGSCGSLLAEQQELPKRIAEFCQRLQPLPACRL